MIELINAPIRTKSYLTLEIYKQYSSDLLCICNDEEEAIRIYNEIVFFDPSVPSFYLPAWDSLPYDRVSPSHKVMAERAEVLCNLSNRSSTFIIVASIKAIINRIPHEKELRDANLELAVGKTISRQYLINFLTKNSFQRSEVATDVGEFSVRGEIIDFVLPGSEAIRVNFEWDKISQIRNFELDSQLTTQKKDHIIIYPANELRINSSTCANFKKNFLKHFGAKATESTIYNSISNEIDFNASEYLIPLFYDSLTTIFSYLKNPRILIDDSYEISFIEFAEQINDFYQARQEFTNNNIYYCLPPEELYLTKDEFKDRLELYQTFKLSSAEQGTSTIYNKYSHLKTLPNFYIESNIQKNIPLDLMLKFCKKEAKKKIIICCWSKSSIERMSALLKARSIEYKEIEKFQYASHLNLTILALQHSFETKDYFFISEQDLFGDKLVKPQTSKKRLKNFLLEAESFTEGELIVHKDHGIGRYLGIEVLNISGQPHECLKLVYSNDDKLYIPVENMDVIKRYGSSDGEVDKLGGVAWQHRKAKLKNRINELAAKLLSIAAEREATTIEPISFSIEDYDAFTAKFPYPETEDQLNSINDIIIDLKSGKPMDRLICGDVGFGKTEVAMRATFMVAASNSNSGRKQVAIIAPTTILARQHYDNFKQRFQVFGFRIKQLSRLVSTSEANDIKRQLANGEIDIIIGTHALLANNINFANLGLMIIDEEHHFGVKQKEKLKDLKKNIHVLTLSATPIPRTLQMALFGLRDLSLIATPPIDRLSVRTSVLRYDPVILRDALMREYLRGGRSFYVSPRIADIKDISEILQDIVPELKFKVAHGQMPPQEIDDIMNEFYDGKFDILLSTTIIESGLDVPAANTIIIHKAEMLGLSQLYQLRGRVGRGKTRGYAYLTLNPKKKPTKEALKRLDIMQTVDSLGAGFSIASHDMDMRGFGNMVGEEQSGHIREVGVELYQDMLNQAIESLRDISPFENSSLEKTNLEKLSEDKQFSPTINLGLSILIPESYISDVSLRMGLYRRIADLSLPTDIEHFKYELLDRFGPIPIELQNLLDVLNIKFLCKRLNIEKLDAGPKGFILKFSEKFPSTAELALKYIQKNPRTTKIKPENKLVILEDMDQKYIIDSTNKILNNLITLA